MAKKPVTAVYLSNEKWIAAFKGHKLVKIEKDIKDVSWKFAPFQVM